MKLMVTDDNNRVVYEEDLCKIYLNCDTCGKYTDFVYMTDMTHHSTLGSKWTCPTCSQKIIPKKVKG